MESKFSSNFIFTVCQVGAEKALKREIAGPNSEFRFAFSRPGLVTFKKIDGELPIEFTLDSVFSRAYGLSIGKMNGHVQSLDLSTLSDLTKELISKYPDRKLRLHIWERDFFAPSEFPMGYVPGTMHQDLIEEMDRKIRSEFSVQFEASSVPKDGDLVIDLILLEKDQWWSGYHFHSVSHSPDPGGRSQIELPEQAPSRAYIKLVEVLKWSQAPLRKGDTAVEIGSAPGGASYALLEKGLSVVGIDPGEMAPIVKNHSNFKHIQRPVAGVLREELPRTVHWLLLDMNVEPRISLYAVDRLVSRMKESALGVFLTIKLNQWEIADQIPEMISHVKAMGMVKVKVAQLSHHRQELAIFGLTRKGVMRK